MGKSWSQARRTEFSCADPQRGGIRAPASKAPLALNDAGKAQSKRRAERRVSLLSR